MAKLGFDLCDLDLWPLTLTFCMNLTSAIGNNSENFMMIQWWEHSEKGVTDRQTDGHLIVLTNPQHDTILDG